MGKRTEEIMNTINGMRLNGITNKEIAKQCGVSPQYVGKLIKAYEENRKCPPEWNYGLSTRILNCLKRNFIPVDPHQIADSIGLLLIMRGIGKSSLDEIGIMLKKLNIISDIDEWIQEGKRKKYEQYTNRFPEFPYDSPQRNSLHIGP